MLALLAVGAIYARDWSRTRAAGGEHTFVADIDRWRRTQRETTIQANYDFSLNSDLQALPLQVGEWQGADIPQTNVEVLILLEPEQYVYRRYARPDGKYVWLSVIGSRQAKSFHSPQICYNADGWGTEMASEQIELADGSVYALRLLAQKEQWQHVVLYFFLYPNYTRDTEGGTVLFKVTAPLEDSLEETVELQKSFVREFFHSAGL
ncbi:MAG: EpsI family protein [Caldilineales bacterium]|nr:EpsI family protein [Caldilineales bacterium]